MKKYWIIGIIGIVVISISIFLVRSLNKSCEIKVGNYNGTSELILGKYKVKHCSVQEKRDDPPLTIFRFDDEEEEERFIHDIKNHTGYMGIYDREYYYFYLYSNGYYYSLRKNAIGDYDFCALYAQYSNSDLSLNIRFPFPLDRYFEPGQNTIKLDMSYEEFIEFYERMPSDEVTIDYENKIIFTGAYEEFYPKGIIPGKPVKIVWLENEVMIEYVGKENNNTGDWFDSNR